MTPGRNPSAPVSAQGITSAGKGRSGAARVSCRVGREPRGAYGESLAGQWQQLFWKNVYQFCRFPISPCVVVENGKTTVRNEGGFGHGFPKPYPVSYRAIVPKQDECANLLVPVCLSSSHVAYGSIRMEPVFMILGQSAGTAASFAIGDGTPVQNVAYDKLRTRLLADGQKL